MTVEGYTPPANEDFDIEESVVHPDYFHAMQVPLAVGRTFTGADDATAQPVAMVNETFVRNFTPRMRLPRLDGAWRRAPVTTCTT